MPAPLTDSRWPKLLSLAVHEFRTPITVVSGYIRMLLKERAGPISDTQRKLLEEAEKSCRRLSGLVAEMSDLSALEAGTAALNRGTADLRELLLRLAADLPPLHDRDVSVQVQAGTGPLPIQADAARLTSALTSLMLALRREVVTSDRLVVHVENAPDADPPSYRLSIADGEQIDAVRGVAAEHLERFDEWRGGSGLSLAVARRIIVQHGGSLLGGPDGLKTAGIVLLPQR